MERRRQRLHAPHGLPLAGFASELIAAEIGAGGTIDYDEPVQAGQEHHLCLLQGELVIHIDAQAFRRRPAIR